MVSPRYARGGMMHVAKIVGATVRFLTLYRVFKSLYTYLKIGHP